MEKTGLLIINLGTPDSPSVKDVRKFLAEFLMDGRVVNLPAFFRALLVYGFILPFRPKKSAKAYQAIWDNQKGSPLLHWSQSLSDKLQQALGEKVTVALAMRYGNPSIESALKALMAKGCDKIIVFSQYPQYAASTSLSSNEKVFEVLSQLKYFPEVRVLGDFYDHADYIQAQAAVARPIIDASETEHVLMSFHGVPQSHVIDTGCGGCKGGNACPPIHQTNRFCYRAQCYQNARELANSLNLNKNNYSVGFQSRLGRLPWITPYTDKVIRTIAEKGVEKLAVMCPSFTVDCLETLEEIGIALKEDWLSMGGKEFTLIPCLNDHPAWVHSMQKIANINI